VGWAPFIAAWGLAATYSVSPAGSDLAAGTPAAPWRTLQRAADGVDAGDLVLVQPGDYTGFTLARSGAPGASIVFAAVDAGVRIATANVNGVGVELSTVSHFRLRGFEVAGTPSTGIRLSNGADIELEGNVVTQSGRSAIDATGTVQLQVLRNTVIQSARFCVFIEGTTGIVVRGNRLEQCDWGAIAVDALPGQTVQSPIVEQNVVIGANLVSPGAALNFSGNRNGLVRNNVLSEIRRTGLGLWKQQMTDPPSADNVIINNTFVMHPTANEAIRIYAGSTSTTVLNNIVIAQGATAIGLAVSNDSRPGLVSNFNALTNRFSLDDGASTVTFAGWTAAGYDSASWVPDGGPLFVNAAGGDFRLAAGSSALDRGTATDAPPTDVVGVARPQGPGVDVGAYERPVAAGGGTGGASGGASGGSTAGGAAGAGGATAGASAGGDAVERALGVGCGCRFDPEALAAGLSVLVLRRRRRIPDRSPAHAGGHGRR